MLADPATLLLCSFSSCLLVDPETGNWKTMCSVATTAGVVCLEFEEHTRTLIAGLDDGAVHLYRVDAGWQDLECTKELTNLHEAKTRVTALALHKRKQYLFSASRDKHMALYDLRKVSFFATCSAKMTQHTRTLGTSAVVHA